MFVYQPTFNMLELQKDKGTYYVIGWKSKSLFESKLFSLNGAFLSNIKCFGYKIRIQFNNTPLGVNGILEMSCKKCYSFLVLIIVNHLILIIAKMIFKCWVKEQLMVLMETLLHQRKDLALI